MTVAALVRGGRVDRWKRVALASVKQSRRAVVPDIRGPLTFETWLDEPPPAMTLMLVEPGASTQAEPLSSLAEQKIPADAAIVVGPEGGWTDAEWAAARQRRRPPRHAGPSHAARRRGAGRRDQRAAVSVGRSLGAGPGRLAANRCRCRRAPVFRPVRTLLHSDLEVLRLRVAVAERDARGAEAVFVEIRRLEPFALLRGIDRREVIPAGGQSADSEMAGLIGPRRRDVTRLRLPERRIGREGEDGVFGDGRALLGGQRAVDLVDLVGERQLDALETAGRCGARRPCR